MKLNIGKEVAQLQRMTVRELRIRYAEVFGEETRAGNKAWLVKRIAWRLQSLAEGDISHRARQRAAELANDADVRLSPPKAKPASPAPPSRTKSAVVTVSLLLDSRRRATVPLCSRKPLRGKTSAIPDRHCCVLPIWSTRTNLNRKRFSIIRRKP